MTFKIRMTGTALRILRVNIGPDDKGWSLLKPYTKEFGPDIVEEAFELWANQQTQTERPIRYPLSEFYRVAPGMVDRVACTKYEVPIVETLTLDNLCTELYLIGKSAFTGKQKDFLGTLLATYTAEDIQAAYTEFISNFDDFEMKLAVRKFSEGGAQAVLSAFQKRQDLLKQQAALIEVAKQHGQARRVARLASTTVEPDEIILPED